MLSLDGVRRSSAEVTFHLLHGVPHVVLICNEDQEAAHMCECVQRPCALAFPTVNASRVTSSGRQRYKYKEGRSERKIGQEK